MEEKKCLITKLQGEVSNENLPYLGQLDFHLVYDSRTDIGAVNFIGIVPGQDGVRWESSTEMYKKIGEDEYEDVGTSGIFQYGEEGVLGNYFILYYREDCEFHIHPMYKVNYVQLRSEAFGQCNLNDVFHIKATKFMMAGASANSFYGENIGEKDFDIYVDNAYAANTRLPWLKGFKDYGKLGFNTKINSIEQPIGSFALTAGTIDTSKDATGNYKVPSIKEFIGEDCYVDRILENDTIKQNIAVISIPFDGVKIENFDSFAGCTKLYALSLHSISEIKSGNIIDGLSNLKNLRAVTVIPPSDFQTTELSTLFNAWSSYSEKRNTTVNWWGSSKYTVNGEPMSGGQYYVTFDDQGAWTVTNELPESSRMVRGVVRSEDIDEYPFIGDDTPSQDIEIV